MCGAIRWASRASVLCHFSTTTTTSPRPPRKPTPPPVEVADEVGGAGVHRERRGLDVPVFRHGDHRHLRADRVDVGDQVGAVSLAVAEVPVEDDEVVLAVGELRIHVNRIARGRCAHPVLLKKARDGIADFAVVVDDDSAREIGGQLPESA